MAKIYTKGGDTKTTGIIGGFRLSKRSDRIETLGSLDELNSFLGFLLALSDELFKSKKKVKITFKRMVEQIQEDLFVIGADLSKPIIKKNSIPHPLHHHFPKDAVANVPVPHLTHNHVHHIEELIDHFQGKLPPLRNFILPQGNTVGSFLQIIRAICRRTERRTVRLAMHSKVDPLILAYLNRLSDLFFVLARIVNLKNRKSETIWKYQKRPPF